MIYTAGITQSIHMFPLYADPYMVLSRMSTSTIQKLSQDIIRDETTQKIVSDILINCKTSIRDHKQEWMIELNETECQVEGVAWFVSKALREFKILLSSSVHPYGRNSVCKTLCFSNIWNSTGNSYLLKRIAESEFHSKTSLEAMLNSIEKEMRVSIESYSDNQVKGFVINA